MLLLIFSSCFAASPRSALFLAVDIVAEIEFTVKRSIFHRSIFLLQNLQEGVHRCGDVKYGEEPSRMAATDRKPGRYEAEADRVGAARGRTGVVCRLLEVDTFTADATPVREVKDECKTHTQYTNTDELRLK